MRPAKRKNTDRGLGRSGRGAENARPLEAGEIEVEVVVEEPTPVRTRIPAPARSGVRKSRPPTGYAHHQPKRRETLSTFEANDEGPRSRDTRRMAACLEEIGPVTAAVAAGHARKTIPRRVKNAHATTGSLDAPHASLLSLVDGRLSVPSLVDVSGMTENDVIGILDRLARLGLITIP